MTQNKIKIVILGASGYAGGDLIRMLSSHKNVDIVALSANAKSGVNPSQAHSSLFNTNLPTCLFFLFQYHFSQEVLPFFVAHFFQVLIHFHFLLKL